MHLDCYSPTQLLPSIQLSQPRKYGHLKSKLNNLHQKWSFIGSFWNHFGSTVFNLFCFPNLSVAPAAIPHWFWPLTSLDVVDSESSAAGKEQQPGGRRATPGVAKVPVATATDRKPWIPLILLEFCRFPKPAIKYGSGSSVSLVPLWLIHSPWFHTNETLLRTSLAKQLNLQNLEGMVWFIDERSPTSIKNDRNQVFHYMFEEPIYVRMHVCTCVCTYHIYI